ncbi:19278_t:CDS:1, partial [Gigaspora margarita]
MLLCIWNASTVEILLTDSTDAKPGTLEEAATAATEEAATEVTATTEEVEVAALNAGETVAKKRKSEFIVISGGWLLEDEVVVPLGLLVEPAVIRLGEY